MTYIKSKANRCTHIQAAVRHAGGNRKLARALKDRGKPVNEDSIADWKRRGSVPAEFCADLEQITGGRFQPERVRADYVRA